MPLEIHLNGREPFLAAPQVAPDIIGQLCRVLCSVSVNVVTLDVLILKYARIHFMTLVWQKIQTDGLLSHFDPIENT